MFASTRIYTYEIQQKFAPAVNRNVYTYRSIKGFEKCTGYRIFVGSVAKSFSHV